MPATSLEAAAREAIARAPRATEPLPQGEAPRPPEKSAVLEDKYGNPPHKRFHKRYGPGHEAVKAGRAKAGDWMLTEDGRLWLKSGRAGEAARAFAERRKRGTAASTAPDDRKDGRPAAGAETGQTAPDGRPDFGRQAAALVEMFQDVGAALGGNEARMSEGHQRRFEHQLVRFGERYGYIPDLPPALGCVACVAWWAGVVISSPLAQQRLVGTYLQVRWMLGKGMPEGIPAPAPQQAPETPAEPGAEQREGRPDPWEGF